MNNTACIERFYTAFGQKDWKSMQACYHEDVTFSDPVFQHLNAGEAKAMWHMLTAASKDLRVVLSEVAAQDNTGSCRWDAYYSFSRTGRSVHNIIHATFQFKDGLIIQHKDSFDLWRWSGMALGLSGKLLGWTPMIQNRIRGTAMGNLKKFMEQNPGYLRPKM
jgi:ketosteroid isomerase-like protein